jgi:hypothetical protein
VDVSLADSPSTQPDFGRAFFFRLLKTSIQISEIQKMFRNADVVRATGLPPRVLSDWLDRGVIVLGRDDVDAAGSGSPRQFSRRRVNQIALTVELSRAGLPASLAAQAAAAFTDAPSPGRAAGDLFANGETLLIHGAAGSRVIAAHTRDDFAAAATDFSSNPGGMVVINVGAVLGRVDAALGTNKREHAA